MVLIDPSLPWVIADNMTSASGPRTSPTMTRSGFIRSVCRTNWASVTAPTPSEFGNRDSISTTFSCKSKCARRPISRESSQMINRSVRSISLTRARSSVVFPARVPPAMMRLNRARTAARKNAASSGLTLPNRTRSARKTRGCSDRRTDTTGRPDSDGWVAASRDASDRRRFSCGLAASHGLGLRPT